MDMSTAESVTRALRSKDARPADVARTAEQLLAGAVAVYLPNAAHFVFDLVCDRMGDMGGKNFAPWKHTPALWRLWHASWEALGGSELDVEFRAKAFTRVKLLPVMAAVLDRVAADLADAASAAEPPVLAAMFACVHTFMSSGYIDVDEHAAVGLVSSYSRMLIALAPPQLAQLPAAYTAAVATIFRLPQQSANYRPSKKSTARFFADAVPPLVALFTHRRELAPDARHTLHDIFAATSFGADSGAVAAHTDTLLAGGAASALDDAGVEYYFHQVLVHLASRDIAACEAVYVRLTAGAFAHMAEQLLGVLSRVNKTLSPGFFAALYAAEVARRPTNWRLVSYVLNLDGAATERWRAVVDGCARAPPAEKLLVLDNIAAGFVRARDFPSFVRDVFPYAVGVSADFAADAVLEALAPKAHEMSASQIRAVAVPLLEQRQMKPMALVARGLLFCAAATQAAVADVFAGNVFCHAGWAEVAFFLVCVYGAPLATREVAAVGRAGHTGYDLKLALRVAELTKNTDHVTAAALQKHIAAADKHEILRFAARWVCLLVRFPEACPGLVAQLFALASPEELLGFVDSHAVVLFELRPFLHALSAHLHSNPVSYQYDLYRRIPPGVFRKFFAAQLAALVETCQTTPQDTAARSALKHVLDAPVLACALERDFSQLYKFADSATPDSAADTFAVCDKIWRRHLHNIKDPVSAAFVAGAVKKLEKKFRKPKDTDMQLARLIFAAHSHGQLAGGFDKLLDKYVAVACATLADDPTVAHIATLSGLPPLSDAAAGQVRSTVKTAGGRGLAPAAQARLFSVVAEVFAADDSLFVVALFAALYDTVADHHEAALASLKSYLGGLPAASFGALFDHCLSSLAGPESPFTSPLVETVAVCASLISNADKDASIQRLMAALSAVASHIGAVHNPAVVVRVLTVFTNLLSSHMWAYKQFTVELTMGLADQAAFAVASLKSRHEDVYLAAVNLLAHTVLFHRFRFSSRYHLVVKIMSNLMMPLTVEGKVGHSLACASAYRRLVVALCEPKEQGSTRDSSHLTSQAAFYKGILRKHAHVLLVNYIYYRLSSGFSDDVTEQLGQGINSVFMLLLNSELQLVVQCLDSTGKTLFQNLYSTYKEHGKWKE